MTVIGAVFFGPWTNTKQLQINHISHWTFVCFCTLHLVTTFKHWQRIIIIIRNRIRSRSIDVTWCNVFAVTCVLMVIMSMLTCIKFSINLVKSSCVIEYHFVYAKHLPLGRLLFLLYIQTLSINKSTHTQWIYYVALRRTIQKIYFLGVFMLNELRS